MAQRKQLSWTELRVGVFALVGLLILMVAIFYVTGAGFLGPKYRLMTYLPEVDQLQTGAPVTLDGIEIGNVESMRLTPHPPDLQHNITLVLRIEKKYQDQIRSTSAATLVTQGLLGDRYVSITRGITGSVIPANGVVPGGEQADMKAIVQRGADVVSNLGVLSTQIGDIINKVNEGQGTIGKVINDSALYDHLNSTAAKLDAMVSSIQQGQGSIGKLVASDELYAKADSAVGKLDDVLTAVHDQKGTVGKLVYDPSAYDSIKGLADKGNALLGDVREGKGTLGKLATDDTLFTNLRDATANVRDASTKLNSNQGTMGKFFTDPAFYDNMTGLTGDLRSLVGDFRQNPKKFLHIKVGIF
jgi:phospholipid/cholesterol/gamma-HCH transport system substrate-binding protein